MWRGVLESPILLASILRVRFIHLLDNFTQSQLILRWNLTLISLDTNAQISWQVNPYLWVLESKPWLLLIHFRKFNKLFGCGLPSSWLLLDFFLHELDFPLSAWNFSCLLDCLLSVDYLDFLFIILGEDGLSSSLVWLTGMDASCWYLNW